jgi:tryptophan synthase beta subunit
MQLAVKKEGVIPAVESSHAFAQAFKDAPTMGKDEIILINQSGRADKDGDQWLAKDESEWLGVFRRYAIDVWKES